VNVRRAVDERLCAVAGVCEEGRRALCERVEVESRRCEKRGENVLLTSSSELAVEFAGFISTSIATATAAMAVCCVVCGVEMCVLRVVMLWGVFWL
jgi:hypothetical protein